MMPVELYLEVRAVEGRLYEDDVVARLPDVPAGHPLADEWRARAASCARLTRYLEGKQPLPAILEVGCGNGWLSARLARIPGSRVIGLDLPTTELAQAVRLFSDGGVSFLAGDVFAAPFIRPTFDAILLASAIQYFPDLPALLRALRPLLLPGGEIHILDSPLYAAHELDAARRRTRAYYEALGFPQMAQHYYHHPVSALDGFNPRWLYNPQGLARRVGRMFGQPESPFPWICVR
jgi:SAM-dependent methyltransferase